MITDLRLIERNGTLVLQMQKANSSFDVFGNLHVEPGNSSEWLDVPVASSEDS